MIDLLTPKKEWTTLEETQRVNARIFAVLDEALGGAEARKELLESLPLFIRQRFYDHLSMIGTVLTMRFVPEEMCWVAVRYMAQGLTLALKELRLWEEEGAKREALATDLITKQIEEFRTDGGFFTSRAITRAVLDAGEDLMRLAEKGEMLLETARKEDGKGREGKEKASAPALVFGVDDQRGIKH